MIALRDRKLWVPPDTLTAKQAVIDTTANPVRSRMMLELSRIPTAVWFTGSSTGSYADSLLDKIDDATQIGVFVVYNIPQRDLGSYSKGGATSESAYRGYIDGLVGGWNNREAIVILEPDALAMAPKMDSTGRAERYRCMNYAVERFKRAGARVHLDGGDSGWVPDPEKMAAELIAAGVAYADGFVTNVSHHRTTKRETAQNRAIVAAIEAATDAHPTYYVDTSRNAIGPVEVRPGESSQIGWCNADAGYGVRPTLRMSYVAYPSCDGFLHVKGHIASDGSREGAPEAGKPYPEHGVRLYHQALPALPKVW